VEIEFTLPSRREPKYTNKNTLLCFTFWTFLYVLGWTAGSPNCQVLLNCSSQKSCAIGRDSRKPLWSCPSGKKNSLWLLSYWSTRSFLLDIRKYRPLCAKWKPQVTGIWIPFSFFSGVLLHPERSENSRYHHQDYSKWSRKCYIHFWFSLPQAVYGELKVAKIKSQNH
jgi:hypothetical protein